MAGGKAGKDSGKSKQKAVSRYVITVLDSGLFFNKDLAGSRFVKIC